MSLHRILTFALVVLQGTRVWAQTTPPESAIHDHDRIVFIGDSITAQGTKGGPGGWVAKIGEGLSLIRPEAKPVLIGVGGSGSTVGAWLGFEKKSRTEPLALDVKETDVGQTLDAGAEIVVVMLGMNDALAPSLKNEAADFDAWIGRYGELIEAIRARAHPRVVALATVTPCTEDPKSPKNRVLAELNLRLAKLAEAEHFLVLPTNAASWQVLNAGRKSVPNFHVTNDFVHPNAAGHLAIAAGMLRGLGEPDAAAKLLAQYTKLYQPPADKTPVLSYTMVRAAGSPDDAVQHFTLQYQWTSPSSDARMVQISVPAGWKTNPDLTVAGGRFEFTGPLDQAENRITLTEISGDQKREQVITIPAGWRIAVGKGQGLGWTQNTTYDPAADQQPLDDSLANGEGLSAPLPFPVGDPEPWQLYVASHDYTGLNRSGSVDMAVVLFFGMRDQAYGARWIYSERERPVDLNLSSQAFAGTSSLGVWLNGKPAYAGKLMGEPGHKFTAPATLHAGWNLLVFKSTFIQWQWQFSIDLAGREGDDLSDLRYATKAPAAKTP